MKTTNLLKITLALVALAFALPIMAHAQAAASAAPAVVAPAPASLPDNVVAWLTPILVPLLIAGVKKIAPSIPSWVLPLVAPVLGFLLGVVNNLALSHHDNLWVAAGLGLLGVAVREVKENLIAAPNGGWPTPTP